MTGVDDALVDGNVTYTITATGSGGGYDVITATITVTNTDNDTTGIIVAPASITTGEDGSSASFTVVLASQPSGDVLITFSGVDSTEGTLSSTSLTFTPSNWNTPQSVTVTGVDDALIDGDITYTIIATGSGGGYDGFPDRHGDHTRRHGGDHHADEHNDRGAMARRLSPSCSPSQPSGDVLIRSAEWTRPKARLGP